jgi:hypothetical protein
MRSPGRLVPLLLSLALLAASLVELASNVHGGLDTGSPPLRSDQHTVRSDQLHAVSVNGLFPVTGVDLTGASPSTLRLAASLFYYVSEVRPSARTVSLKLYLIVPFELLLRLGSAQPGVAGRVGILYDRRMGGLDPAFRGERLRLFLATCSTSLTTPCEQIDPIDVPLATVADSLDSDLLALPAFTTTVTMPTFDANPEAYPGDGYAIHIRAALATVPPLGFIDDPDPSRREILPISVDAGQDEGFTGHDIEALAPPPSRSRSSAPNLFVPIASLYIFRSTPSKLYVYGMASVPILFAFMAAGLLRRRAGQRTRAPDPALLFGLVGATLTVLPLRAVLVPDELRGVAITRVDLILATEVALLITFAAFVQAAEPLRVLREHLSAPVHRVARSRATPVMLLATGLAAAVAMFFLPWFRVLGDDTVGPPHVGVALGLLLGSGAAACGAAVRAARTAAATVLLVLAAGALALVVYVVVEKSDTLAVIRAGVGLAFIASLGLFAAAFAILARSAQSTDRSDRGR